MTDILEKLHQDHIHAAKLLDLYDKQLQVLKEGGDPNYIIMRDIMKYMRSYPDVVHHPLEEIIFEKMEDKDKLLDKNIEKLCKQHREIDDIGDELYDKLSTIAAGIVTSLEDFKKGSEKYLELMRSHMDLEEGEVFPRIRELFTEVDWEDVDLELTRQHDPMFGAGIEEQYEYLYDCLLSEGNESGGSADS
jgi:hemerythrin-like domain-containing protein